MYVGLMGIICVFFLPKIKATEKYTTSVFYVTMRRLVTERLHQSYFTDIYYYHLNVLDTAVDNP